jgi:putative phosphoesterase
MRVGLISDTHGLIRPEALAALDGVELILHAGDVGPPHVLHELERFAPVHSVEGNTDDPAMGLPERVTLTLAGVAVLVTHGHELGSPTPARLAARYDADIIVFGHTHRPVIEQVGATLVVNPGAAGPPRFNLLPSVAILELGPGGPEVRIVTLERSSGGRSPRRNGAP